MQHVLTGLCSDHLILDYKLPVWERLHGIWRTLPNFNPLVVSSEPGQDLAGEAQRLLFPSRTFGDGDASEEEEPEDNVPGEEIEDVGLLGLVEGTGAGMDVDAGLEGFPDDASVEVYFLFFLIDFH